VASAGGAVEAFAVNQRGEHHDDDEGAHPGPAGEVERLADQRRRFSAQTGASQAVAKEVLCLRGILPSSRVRNPTKPLSDRMRTSLQRVIGGLDHNLNRGPVERPSSEAEASAVTR
jgi:hypothetical protein